MYSKRKRSIQPNNKAPRRAPLFGSYFSFVIMVTCRKTIFFNTAAVKLAHCKSGAKLYSSLYIRLNFTQSLAVFVSPQGTHTICLCINLILW